ncbi:LOW QUALITY PROTEIN: neuroblast differentiation-associated protein AHNAK-like [Oncorhynchus masou masou]|uniref:LOW QUALITY PROTEIN: neuroblast differentiation-associated protein AHNAK-like n=1 Tax=Oncorhynchus masou masou TaxID=90313 RepID=UPI0031832FD5
MDSSTDAQAVEEAASEVVEVVLETEAEAGASGYSVTGGGERGLFIKDVLKDSTAAKHLSLQQGDQLLSARVYFDNVKYEDALKILQCAEPYKVSFFLKRTITGADVTMHPGTTSLELKGPKTKMQKMSVKSIKPFKVKKKKGGRFGLKRLKENKKGSTGAELEMEGSSSKVERNPIDVEFAFPMFKLGKDGKAEEAEQHGGVVATGRKKRTIRCPSVKANGAEAATGGEVDITEQADVSLPDVPGAKVKVKGKGHRFGIHFPKTKKTKSDTALSGGSLDLKPPGVKFTPPSVEFSLPSGNKDVDLQKREVKVKEWSKLMHREVELSLGLPSACHSDEIDGEIKAKGLAEGVEGSTALSGIKMPVIDISAPNIDLQLDTRRTVPDEIEGPFFKGPNIFMPKTDISLSKIGSSNMDIDGPEKFKTPTFDVSLPKFKSPEEHMNIEGPEVKGEFNMPKVDLLRPKGKAEGEVDIEGYLGKGGQFQMPTFDISLPKMKSSEREMIVEGPEVKGGKIKMPSIDISLPKGKTEGNINIEGHSGKGGKFKMPSCDISPPKMKGDASLEGPELKGGKFEMPTLDISLAKGKTEGGVNIDENEGKEGKFSLPKIKLPKGDMKIEGSDVKGITFHMPTIDCSLPTGKTEGHMSVEGDASKGGKSHTPSFDISAPRVKLPEGKAKVEGPEIKGGKVEMPKMDVSLPKGKTGGEVNIEGHVSKGSKFKMPTFGISFPKLKSPEGKGNTEGPEVKGEKFKMPTIGISLPKGKSEGDINVEADSEAGGKFHMPTCDISLPKMKSPDADISLEGPEVKGGKCHMPTIDLSLPKGIDTEGHSGKGGKFQMPAFDISHPKMKTPDGEVSLEVPEVKRGNINMPTMNISLPEGKMEGEAKGHASKGGKPHMPSVDISLPKMKLPEGEVSLEGPDVKGGMFKMPKIDISLPKGKTQGGIDIEGHLGKGKFHMPTCDMSLPKMKSNDGDMKLEGPEVKGSKIHMPKIDNSLPKGKAECDIQVEGHGGKGGKFHMPSIDISISKMKLPEGEVKVEGPEAKDGKFEIPTIDISLQKGKAEGEIDMEGHSVKGGKFPMPKFDVSLPKMKPDGDIKLEGPEGKGNKIHVPNIDISLPKGKTEGDIEVEGHGGKGGKFHMPSIDISLPKMKLPEGEVKVEGPEAKGGNTEMPSIDISLPKGKMEGEIDIEVHSGKGGRFHMPTFDVSLPKMKSLEPDVSLEGPDVKGGKFEMPKIDILLPKGKTEGETDIEEHSGNGGKFHMTSFDVSLPKMKHPVGDVKKGLEVKGGTFKMPKIEAEGRSGVKLPTVKLPTVDVSAPKVDFDSGLSKSEGDDREETELQKAEGERPSSGSSFDMPDISLKMPRFSLPKFGGKSSGDVNLEGYGTEDDIDISPPRADGEGRPASAEIRGEGKIEGKLKKPKMKMPMFGISKKDVSIASPDVEIKTEKGKVDIPKPGISVEHQEDKANRKYRLKFPKFKKSSPKGKLPEGEIDVSMDSGMEGKGGIHAPDDTIKMPKFSMPGFGSQEIDFDSSRPSAELDVTGKVKIPSVEISLPAAKKSEQEVLLPKAEVDVSEADIRGYEGNLKIPKMPTIDVSAPNIDLDVTLPKIKHETKIEGDGGKFKMPNIKMPDIDLSLPKEKTGNIDASKVEIEGRGGKFKMPVIKMPKVDISLPIGRHRAMDVSTEEIEGEGVKFKMPHMEMPNVDISLTKGKSGGIEGPEMEIEGGDGNLKMPHMKMPVVDLSLPKGKYGDISAPEMEMEGGGKFKMPHMKMPNFDISLPKGKSGKIEGPDMEIQGDGGKLKMPHMKIPTVDLSLPKGKSGDKSAPEIEMEGGTFKMPHIKMPNIDLSLPKGKSGEIEGPEVEIEGEGGKFKMPHMKMPNIHISLPKGKTGDVNATESEIEGDGGKFQMPHMKIPSIGTSLPKGKSGEIEGPEVEIEGEGGKFKMPHMKMPNIHISLPKGKTGDVNATESEIEGDGGKFQMPHMKIPSIGTSLPKGKSGEIEGPEMDNEGEGGKFKMPHIKMPNVDISLPRGKTGEIEAPEMEIQSEGGKFKMPKVDILLPKGKGGEIEAPEMEIQSEGGKFKMPKVDISLSKGKGGEIEAPEMEIQSEGGKFNMPKVDISLRKGKYGEIRAPEMEVKGGNFKMPNIAISLPKGKSGDVNAPELEMDGEGGRYKMPEIKLSNIDITMPKGNSGDIDAEIKQPNAEAEGKIKMPLIGLPKFTTPDLDLDMNVGKPNHGAEVHGKSSDKTGSHSEGDHKTKIKMPTIDIECPKGDLELDIGFHKAEGKKDRKIIELPDLDLKTSGTKGKGPKVKSTKFKIGLPKMKNTGDQALDATTKKAGKENEGASGRFMMKKTKLGKGADVAADVKAGGSVLPNISLPDVGFSVSKGPSQEDEGHGPEMSAKLPKFKLPNVEISGPSMTGQGGAQINSGQQENKDGIKFQMLKSKQGSAEPTGTDAGTENGFTLPNLGIKVDIGASQAEDQGADTSTRQKIKIPKFGVALPAMSSPEARVHLKDPEVEYEGPKMPKVKKAVFVLVNPQTDHSTMSTMCEASVESGEAKIRMPKIKMKPSFGKSGSKEKSVALSIEGDVDRDDKSKGAKLKMPKVTFSPGKTGSFDVTLKGEGSSSSLNDEKVSTFQNGSKEDKAKFVKLKLPKIEFSSPYSKIGRGEEDLEMSAKLVKESSGTDGETKRKKVKSGKMSFPGFKKKTSKGEEETQDSVVSSSARTEMLDQDSSESQTPMVSIGFVPGKSRGQAEAESSKKELEGKQSTWFKAPKFNLKPNSTGILLITPEGSPQGSRSSLQCQGVDETAGTFQLQMPNTGFSMQEVSEENITTTKEGTVTVVTKTTKNTVTESRTGQTHTSLSHCNH